MFHNQLLQKSSLIAVFVFACAFTINAQSQRPSTQISPIEKIQANIKKAEQYKAKTTDPAMRAKYEQTIIALKKELAGLTTTNSLSAADKKALRAKESEAKRREGEKITNLPSTDMTPKPLQRAN